ncbi:hypothetical protein LSAT2_004874 [Lamellibrachia satsuma]|nr:hypothetical protein LSAT2_004874 [Lamellibrachia satsuma]
MSACKTWVVCLAILQMTSHVQGGAILEAQMVSYQNPDGTDWDYKNCDNGVLGKRWKCDLKFTFCFDKSTGNWDPDNCSYKKAESGEYQNQHHVTFGPKISSFANPIKLTFGSWPSAIRFKLKVVDDDSFNGDDLVDRMNVLWRINPRRSVSQASWSNRLVVGTRPHTKTSLAVKVRLYCQQNYYNSQCSKYCTASNGPNQYYTCDPATGAKVCRPGWEGTNCDVISDDCIDNSCTNGATCQDGRRQYTCICHVGFAGKYCEANIDDCAAAPCLNGGRCVDKVAGYSCVCQPEYVGDSCSHHVCDSDQSPCLNGGTCYVRRGKTRCMCPVAFSGDVCERDKCLDMTCLNQGDCENGTCVCRPGFLGALCSLDLCLLMPCMNGASCEAGVCRCAPGFTGLYCQTEANECESDPCQHDGTCRDRVNGYTCDCLPDYNGTRCEHVMPTSPPPIWDHVVGTPSVIGSDDSTMPPAAMPSKSGSIPFWTIGVVVGLINIVIAALVILYIMRRRVKRKELTASVETAVEFRLEQDVEGGVAAFVNPHYDVIPALSCSCADVTPPPYTATAEGEDTETYIEIPSTDDIAVGEVPSPNTHFTKPVYDVPPEGGAAIAKAAGPTPEAPELPIKSALR